jgi:hypothetical protein
MHKHTFYLDNGYAKCEYPTCKYMYTPKEIEMILADIANDEAAERTCFPACKTCEYNPCDIENNGVEVGTCTYHMPDGVCPRHGRLLTKRGMDSLQEEPMRDDEFSSADVT